MRALVCARVCHLTCYSSVNFRVPVSTSRGRARPRCYYARDSLHRLQLGRLNNFDYTRLQDATQIFSSHARRRFRSVDSAAADHGGYATVSREACNKNKTRVHACLSLSFSLLLFLFFFADRSLMKQRNDAKDRGCASETISILREKRSFAESAALTVTNTRRRGGGETGKME